MSNNQDETTPGKEEHTELTTNVSKADLELNLLSESDKSVELGDVDIKQNQENVDIQVHAPELDRSSSFNDDLQMESNKKIESLEMQTQVKINIDTNISQPLDLESSLSIRDREMNSAADGYLTVIKQLKLKQLKLQPHTSLNRQVIYMY